MDINRGIIISVNNDMYYVYGITSTIVNTFLMFELNKPNEKSVLIDNKPYLLCFQNECNFDLKTTPYKVLNILSENEINYIKQLRKDFHKNNKNKDKDKVSNKQLKICDIVSRKHDYLSRYLIVGLHGSRLLTIDINALLNNNIIKYEHFKYADVSKCNNVTSIELQVLFNVLGKHKEDQYLQKLLKLNKK